MIKVGGLTASLDFLIAAEKYNPGIISFYDRSLAIIKSIGASLNANWGEVFVNGKSFFVSGKYEVIISPIITGKDKYYHAIAISKLLNSKLFICKVGEEEEAFYSFLMNQFNLPLMKKWSRELFNWCLSKHYIISDENVRLLKGSNSNSSITELDELRIYAVRLDNERLESCVKSLFKQKRINITNTPQEKLTLTNMDTYFKKYGKSLVENLEKTIHPLTELNGNIDSFVFKHMRLFPQQAAQVNGVFKLLDRSSYVLLNEGMGTGKTPQAAGLCEGYFVRKYLKANPDKTLKDAYIKDGIIKYRNIVMCPGHIVKKWANHIRKEIPYAKVTILNDFSQLLEIKKRGIERTEREFYVISKDFAKLSYQKKPIPTKRRYYYIMKKVCLDCESDVYTPGKICPHCNSSNISFVKSGYKGTGMVCPECNNILIPYKTAKLQNNLDGDEITQPLDHTSFTHQCDSNSKCYYCDSELWQPHVANLGNTGKSNIWYRVTHYANKARKNTKTVWVHRSYDNEYFNLIGEKPLNIIDTNVYQGTRKVAPGVYIKKQLKGFFDFAIFDEVHELKSGTSAQANCMSAIISASKKHLALTGTIAGGMANHIFYLIFRLDPSRMISKGYKWDNEVKFSEKYGVIERKFEANDTDGQYNSSSRGRQKGSPSVRPGISPLIFMDFLLDKTVFLDLSDLSKYLPPLKEKVELVEIPKYIETPNGDVIENPECAMLKGYNIVIHSLKMLSRQKDGGRGILSTMLQFSLSYLDKPYGVSPILSPKTGAIIAKPYNYPSYANPNNLLSKEKKLIEIVNKEQKEGRNIVVYAEFTGSPETCVSYRLKEILELHCNLKGQVEIIDSSYPAASKREEWMHKKAAEGIKVFITNPRNVETGLDFCFDYKGVSYNFPTLIFYQMGYSLFTIWQASRRHYRLNQRKECRTYYLAVKNTIQEAVIGLIAEKMAATSAIQGKFSTEGLSAMANGIDARMKLAQALSDMDNSTGSDLQGMFDVINQDDFDDSKYKNYRPMLTLEELLGDDYGVDKTVEEMSQDIDINGIMELFDDFLRDFSSRNNVEFHNDAFNEIPNTPNLPKARKRKIEISGQISLF